MSIYINQSAIKVVRIDPRVIVATARESIQKFQPTFIDDTVAPASNLAAINSFQQIGIALSDAVAGQSVRIQIDGIIKNPLWQFRDGKNIFLGDKVVTQITPESGFLLILGFPIETNSMYLSPKIPIGR